MAARVWRSQQQEVYHHEPAFTLLEKAALEASPSGEALTPATGACNVFCCCYHSNTLCTSARGTLAGSGVTRQSAARGTLALPFVMLATVSYRTCTTRGQGGTVSGAPLNLQGKRLPCLWPQLALQPDSLRCSLTHKLNNITLLHACRPLCLGNSFST